MALADKGKVPLTKTYDIPIEKVYPAMVQVASMDYNLKTAVREAHTAVFYTGGEFSLVLSAICREAENGKTVVSISVAQAEGNPAIFRVAKAKNQEAKRFWSELDEALKVNQALMPDSSEAANSTIDTKSSKAEGAQLTIKSIPAGADITLDGKFAGSTPSTLQIKSGTHTVRVTLNSFVAWERSLDVTAGDQITLNANLQRKQPGAP